MIALALLMASTAAPAPAHDRLHYGMGGTMSGFVDLSIDFVTGDFSLEERPSISGQPIPPVKRGRLPLATVARLRALARVAVRAGLETQECVRRYRRNALPMMPNIDAMPSMDVTLSGRSVSAPVDIGCWSAAANRLSDAAYTAAKGG